MTLRVFNSLTKQKETFAPAEPGKVKMYVCGVTPYNHPHIGNARPFITWDVIRRYLEQQGYSVYHVQNFTDVDDKIIATANTEGVGWADIADRYIAAYFEVMDKLNIRRAQLYPRVSEHMAEIVEMVATLIEKGFAYVVDGDVYYSVEKFDEYGKLSGRNLDDMKAGARVDIDERKNHPMDFALWKSAKPGEPSWTSPWGQGRPGWHIECSAMSQKYLGAGFDFHGGGSDLIFPHHENEIAQSEAYSGVTPFVRYWLHNGFITVNEEKMSKSLGNFFLVKDILEHYPPEVLRFFILSTHYRSPLNFSDEQLAEAGRGLDRLRTAVSNVEYLAGAPVAAGPSEQATALLAAGHTAKADFTAAMDDDFNTALAISILFGLAKEINIYYSAVMAGKIPHDAEIMATVQSVYYELADILGLLVEERTGAPNAGGKSEEQEELIVTLLDMIVDIRQEARRKKDWSTADAIRDRLDAVGYVIEDSPQGARWKKREV
ncbi:MAG: cysteine--tRNA ligase [Negativicutes bacterium]|nr:cysteine--tRNA ligase [Negativicutes bacterium]